MHSLFHIAMRWQSEADEDNNNKKTKNWVQGWGLAMLSPSTHVCCVSFVSNVHDAHHKSHKCVTLSNVHCSLPRSHQYSYPIYGWIRTESLNFQNWPVVCTHGSHRTHKTCTQNVKRVVGRCIYTAAHSAIGYLLHAPPINGSPCMVRLAMPSIKRTCISWFEIFSEIFVAAAKLPSTHTHHIWVI